MKTAKEFVKQLRATPPLPSEQAAEQYWLQLFQQIQIDAFIAGERFAADKLTERETNDKPSIEDYRQAILTDANKRTELP